MLFRRMYISRFIIPAVILLMQPISIYSQSSGIKGYVYDTITGESLPGVNIIIDTLPGGATDYEGAYSQTLTPGVHVFVFKHIGYKDNQIYFTVEAGITIQKDIFLHPISIELNTAVVSAARYEQRLSDVIVSMEVIPSEFIETVNTYYLDETISLLSGVDIVDGQANIRGGSGFTYGAGSRVMVLMDDLPILSGGVGDVKWNSLPVEVIDKVEIIKGASSALYGTSAMNGVIHLRTARPGINPSTTIDVSMGLYMKPKRKEVVWFWDHNPIMGNIKFSHMQKSGPVDVVISGSGLFDEGYRKDNEMKYGRLNAGIRYNPKRINTLSAGLNAGYQLQALTDFLIWKDADSGAYIQNPDAITPMHGYRLNLDPYVTFYDTYNGRHSLNTRYYRVVNQFDEDEDKNNNSDIYFGEYQYQKSFFKNLMWSVGAVFSYTEGKTSLYGNHYGSTQALYTQCDYKLYDRLGLSLGVRWERYTLDKTDKDSRPVFRTGINYQVSGFTFVRASYGQGFRYPSMAEKYTSTGVGGLKIFPSEDLSPETGWSAEIGIKQGFLFNNWSGFIDIAGYWTEYDDMIEFIFGLYTPPGQTPTIDHVGFKSVNTGRARINGVDISINGRGQAGSFVIKYFAGYTYMNPLDLSEDSLPGESGKNQILKYRYRHSVKGDITMLYQLWDVGITPVYRSFMERIDAAFEENVLGQYFFPGLKEYREQNNEGTLIFNFRFGWQVSPSSKISFHINNLFNKEYMGRPGDLQPPRSIRLQYLLKIN